MVKMGANAQGLQEVCIFSRFSSGSFSSLPPDFLTLTLKFQFQFQFYPIFYRSRSQSGANSWLDAASGGQYAANDQHQNSVLLCSRAAAAGGEDDLAPFPTLPLS